MFACCKKKEQTAELDPKDTGIIIHLADKEQTPKQDQEIFTKKDNSTQQKLPALKPLSAKKPNVIAMPNKTAKPIIQRSEQPAPVVELKPVQKVEPKLSEEDLLRQQAIKELEAQFGKDDPLARDEDMIRSLMEKKRSKNRINIKQQFNQVGV